MARTTKTDPAAEKSIAADKSDEAKSKELSRPRSKLSTAEARREYQRRYYQMHKEKAKEYQRQYNLTHKKKARVGRGKNSQIASREVVRSTFNTSDIMHAPVEKTLKMLEKIIKGERLFTM